jgi:hypothetical protein
VIVTTDSGQRIVGAATVPLGTSAAGSHQMRYGLCYQSSGGGTITNFVGNGYTQATIVNGTRDDYSAAAAVNPGAGTWNVGFCVFNNTYALDNSDFVNGWVMVTP